MKIHPTAVISRDAQLGSDVEIGPFSIVEGSARLGDGCVLAARVTIKHGTELGPANRVYEGAVLGGLPQHVKMPARPGRLIVGAGNTIRENVTMHRALAEHAATVVGDSSLFMVGAHVGHDCQLGNELIVANNVMLGGHVWVENQAYISGGVAIHQFCRIGRLSMVGGQARVIQDVPPFVTIDGATGYVTGLNIVGLRRRGFSLEEINQLKAAYRLIFRRRLRWTEILHRLSEEFATGPAAAMAPFLSASRRGIVRERRVALAPTTLRIHSEPADGEGDAQRKLAG